MIYAIIALFAIQLITIIICYREINFLRYDVEKLETLAEQLQAETSLIITSIGKLSEEVYKNNINTP